VRSIQLSTVITGSVAAVGLLSERNIEIVFVCEKHYTGAHHQQLPDPSCSRALIGEGQKRSPELVLGNSLRMHTTAGPLAARADQRRFQVFQPLDRVNIRPYDFETWGDRFWRGDCVIQ
jgi:hypothetical protein